MKEQFHAGQFFSTPSNSPQQDEPTAEMRRILTEMRRKDEQNQFLQRQIELLKMANNEQAEENNLRLIASADKIEK